VSWLTNNGEFKSVMGAGNHHYLDAIKYTKLKNDPMGKLYKKGWQRVVCGSNSVYTGNQYSKPNNIQLRKLIELAIELDRKEVVWENRNGKYQTLWSKDDVLEIKI
jgi:hypothetical protein